MPRTILVVFDTNFFVALGEVLPKAEVESFVGGLLASFVENNFRPVVPSRVLAEVEHFNRQLSRIIESEILVEAPIDIEHDTFFTDVTVMNEHMHRRWFNPGEVTDIEILTVAKHLVDDRAANLLEHAADEIWIISDDEGVENAASFLFKDDVIVKGAGAFLGAMMAVSDNMKFQDAIALVSQRLFKYFTSYRTSEGRRPVAHIEAFFAQMLESIRMARDDINGNFSRNTITELELALNTGNPLPEPLTLYAPVLAIVRESLAAPDAVLVQEIDLTATKIINALGALLPELAEPTDYTRIYNFIAFYLMKLFLDAFKINFIDKQLHAAFKYLTLAKAIVQPFLNQPVADRLYFSIIIVETVFCVITGYKDKDYISENIGFLVATYQQGHVPALVPVEQINLLLLANQLLNGAGIEVADIPGEICIPSDDSSLACPRSILQSMVLVIEDFCDELVEFGRHDVALDIHVNLLPLVQNDEEEKTRIEGKIYLDCLLLNQAIPVCVETPFCEGWETTQEALENDKTYAESTPIDQVDEAYRKRIKVLRYDASNSTYTCWVYPLRSKFFVQLSVDAKPDVPEALKEFRIVSGAIRVEAFDEAARASSGARGLVEVSPGADIYMEFYREKFFTLNLV
jgi:hypothetical protein